MSGRSAEIDDGTTAVLRHLTRGRKIWDNRVFHLAQVWGWSKGVVERKKPYIRGWGRRGKIGKENRVT